MPSTVPGAEETLGNTADHDSTFEDCTFPCGRQRIRKGINQHH